MAHTPTQRVFLHPGNRAKAQVSMRSKINIRGSAKNARPKLTVPHPITHPYITASDGSAVRRRATWGRGHLSTLVVPYPERLPYLGQIASCHAYQGVVWRQGDEPPTRSGRVLGPMILDSESRRGRAHEDIWGRETHSNLYP